MKRIWTGMLLAVCILTGCSGQCSLPEEVSVSVPEVTTGAIQDTTNVPALAECADLREEEILQRLQGLRNTDLHALWGEPHGSLFGMWGDIWETADGTAMIVYFDAGGIVENVKFTFDDEEASESVTEEQMQEEQLHVWGLTLTAKDVTAQGLTLVCTQSGGEPSGELQTGSFYTVQQNVNGHWKQVEYTQVEEEQVGWTEEAWTIPKEGTVEWEVNWSWLYDELPAGEYRIGKGIMDFRGPGDWDEVMLYAEFVIE